MEEKRNTTVRILGFVAAPFVLLWDASKALILGFFELPKSSTRSCHFVTC